MWYVLLFMHILSILTTVPVSTGSCSAEGVVVRTVCGFKYDEFERRVAKYVRENHVQTDTTWKRTWKQAKLVNK